MVTAIVLAAGISKRMGKNNKMLLPYKGSTIIAITVKSIIASGVEEIIVITGYESQKIQEQLAGLPVQLIHNPDYERGMTTSIQQGVKHAKGEGYMICPGDMLYITPGEYALLCSSFERQYAINNSCIVIPVYKGEKGNPVIFSKRCADAILQHDGMEGCKGVVQQNMQNVLKVEMPTGHILLDIDYPEDYQLLMNQ